MPTNDQIVQQLKGLAEQSIRDPVRAAVIARQIAALVGQLSSQNPGSNIGQIRTMRVPGLAAVAASGISAQFPVRWPSRALVTGILGFAVAESFSTGLGMTSLMWQALIQGGDRSLVVNGQAQDFMLFAAAFGLFGNNWYPLNEEVTGTDSTWQVTFRNLDTANPHTPELYFRYILLPDKK